MSWCKVVALQCSCHNHNVISSSKLKLLWEEGRKGPTLGFILQTWRLTAMSDLCRMKVQRSGPAQMLEKCKIVKHIGIREYGNLSGSYIECIIWTALTQKEFPTLCNDLFGMTSGYSRMKPLIPLKDQVPVGSNKEQANSHLGNGAEWNHYFHHHCVRHGFVIYPFHLLRFCCLYFLCYFYIWFNRFTLVATLLTIG